MNETEAAILRALLAGDREELAILRDQAANAEVRAREHTGVGFYTYFSVPPGVPRLENTSRLLLSDVGADVEDVRNGAGFILWVADGLIDCLEGFTYGDDAWPQHPRLVRWYYVRPRSPCSPSMVETDTRDLEQLFRENAG